uniref:TAR (HIV-1) RNA binding protein 1 n=1 Tax=Fundulus heteroclitus TaxID=8078 RepID=A0A3Q2P2Q8_FUNHE
MHSALIHAVLSSSPDYDLLLDSLCWPAESWPQTERVEALTALVQALRPALTDSDAAPAPLTAASRRSIRDKIESVIWARCLPFLCRISAEPGDEARCRESAAAVCGLLGACVGLCGEGVRAKVVSSALQSLQRVSEEEMLAPGTLSVQVATEVLAALMPLLTADEKLTLDTLNCALSSIRSLPDDLVSKVVLRVILTLLSCCGEASSDRVPKRVLEHVCSWHSTERTPGVTRRTLLCLTVLSDHLLDSHSDADPRLCPQFWRMVQDGLTHGDSLTRKRALYLLKRCAVLSEVEGFDCQSSTSEEGNVRYSLGFDSRLLREFWEDYTLVMETLEENQVHVVRPVLNRIDALIQATVDDGSGLFHPSWLLCVYQRMFHSENKSLMREGVCHLLELRALRQPAFAAAFSQFVVGSFMNVLSETSLFCRSPGQSVGECPELAVKLQDFLVTFFTSLPPEDRGRVLLQLIQQLGSKHWCAVPLLFVCQALSRLPPSPLLRNSGLAAMREVLRCTMITHQVLLRGAAQCFLLNGALSLTDVSEVTRDDLFTFLMHFRADESLCRGTDTLNAYVQQEVLAYLRVPASTGESGGLPDAREADKLARAVLLCVDAERRRLGAESSDALEPLLSPLLDTLSRVYTNIYLPVRKSDKSLQLTLRLLQLATGPRGHRLKKNNIFRICSLAEKYVYKVLGLPELVHVSFFFFFHSDLVAQGVLQQDWGRIAANFLRDQWICLNFLIRAVGTPESAEMPKGCATLGAALRCGVEALALLPSDLVLPVLSFMKAALPRLVDDEEDLCVQALTMSWELVQGLSTNAHDFWPALKAFVSLAFQHELLSPTPHQVFAELLELSQSKGGVFGVLLQHCCHTWLPSEQGSGEQADAVFSSVFNHLDIVSEACVYGPVFRRDQRLVQDVQTYVEQLGEKCTANVTVARDDQLPRVCVLAFLSRLDPCVQQHQRLMEELVMELLRKVLMTTGAVFTSPFVFLKVVQLRKALDVILQSCFNHHFSVRLYALLALKRVWSLAESLTEEADAFRGLSSVVTACLSQAEAMQSSGNANKNWVRIQRHFFFGAFHPISDYSVETIFHTFPSLSELADDEWVPPWKFEKLSFFSQSPSLPLRNATPDLGQLQPGDWVQQDQSKGDSSLQQQDRPKERWAEVQKKITPWRLGVHEQEPELKLVPAQRAARLGKQHGALLVVASPIDTTCEIFGASGLVLDTLHHLNDKHFQSLSVSSELWLPLLEVKPVELSGFLQVKKSEGYCIVGVEQTANSQSLQDFKFPEKTLLLLGNEREGIPANLLQMLDVCVEIPQQGIIRSLNVHVSAALLIWEYTRQHLIPGSNEGDQQRG